MKKSKETKSFYDVKSRKSFRSSAYRTRVKGGRKYYVSKSPYTGIKAHRAAGRVSKKR